MLTAEPIFRASGLSFREFQYRVRASVARIKRARTEPISVALADTWCVRIGKHPVEVYGPGLWLAALEEVS